MTTTTTTTKKTCARILATLVVLGTACGMEGVEPSPEDVTTTERALVCSNDQAVNAVLAGLATSTALEVRRWLPVRDFVFANGTLALSSFGRARCPNGTCTKTQTWLNLQNWSAQGTIIGGQPLDVGTLRLRIASQWQSQVTCSSRPDGHAPGDCPSEIHDLVFSRVAAGTCGQDYWFHAYRAGTTTPLAHPEQVRNNLIWAGSPANPYIAFANQGSDVKIDPQDGTQGGGGSGTPSGFIFDIAPNLGTAPYCTSAIADGAVSSGGVTATVGGLCRCMTSPTPQPVYTFKPAVIAGLLKCKP